MSRASRLSLPPLLLLALLAAAAPLLAGEDAEKPPGRLASGKCATAGVTLKIEDAASPPGDLRLHGSWKATGGAAGILLEVRVNSSRYHSELQHGAAGSYGYDTDFVGCDLQVIRVFGSPIVREGNREVECLTRGHSEVWKLQVDCSPSAKIVRCDWDCSDPSADCSGTCTGTAEGGENALVALWGVNGADYATVEGASFGPWTAAIRCKPGDTVSFRVRDQAGNGTLSPPAKTQCGAR